MFLTARGTLTRWDQGEDGVRRDYTRPERLKRNWRRSATVIRSTRASLPGSRLVVYFVDLRKPVNSRRLIEEPANVTACRLREAQWASVAADDVCLERLLKRAAETRTGYH